MQNTCPTNTLQMTPKHGKLRKCATPTTPDSDICWHIPACSCKRNHPSPNRPDIEQKRPTAALHQSQSKNTTQTLPCPTSGMIPLLFLYQSNAPRCRKQGPSLFPAVSSWCCITPLPRLPRLPPPSVPAHSRPEPEQNGPSHDQACPPGRAARAALESCRARGSASAASAPSTWSAEKQTHHVQEMHKSSQLTTDMDLGLAFTEMDIGEPDSSGTMRRFLELGPDRAGAWMGRADEWLRSRS